MNFYIDKLLLWLKNGQLRTLSFSNDKVNVITGNSKTGKTAILEIIDYCLCGSKETVVISYEHIAENVAWYGIRFFINDKTYTIARGEITEKGKFSNEYFFSQTGEIPAQPCVKMEEAQIKTILEQEFSINDNVTISYGGKSVRKNAKLSFRYFLVFNTLSKDIIDNGKTFFDKMHIERYRDVWPQIFDLALGVINFETLQVQKKIADLQQEIYALDMERKKVAKRLELRSDSISLLVKQAKEAGLIEEGLDVDEAFKVLERLIENNGLCFSGDFPIEQEYERIQQERDDLALQLAKLRRFKKSYSEYRERLREEEDSLQPIIYIQKQFTDKTRGEYLQFLTNLSNELKKVRSAIKERRPFEYDVDHKIRDVSKRIKELDSQLSKTARVEYQTIPAAQKLISFGEIKAEYRRLEPQKGDDHLETKISEKEKELEEIEGQNIGIAESRELTIKTLNEYIQSYIHKAKDELDEYGQYWAWFDYKKAILTLKKDKAAAIANISSSSDHLYMHLCLFAGLHHMLLSENTPYVPSFLIIDQPSRPYFNTEEYSYKDSEKTISNKDDWSKVKGIFALWDYFFTLILSQKKHFQVIMLEHVSENAWSGCHFVNLVDIFDGEENALIPIEKEAPPTSSNN